MGLEDDAPWDARILAHIDAGVDETLIAEGRPGMRRSASPLRYSQRRLVSHASWRVWASGDGRRPTIGGDMGWKGVISSLAAADRRSRRAATTYARQNERAAMRLRKELLKQEAQQNVLLQAQREVQLFANYLDLLVSVHKDSSDPWRWDRIVVHPRPSEPQPTAFHERSARAALDAYKPGFFARLFGSAEKERMRLEFLLRESQAMDDQLHGQALTQFRNDCESWEWFHALAQGVLARDPKAYRLALDHLVSLDEIEEQLGSSFSVRAVDPTMAVLDCAVRGSELVPEEELSLGAKGKINHKKMAQGKYWAFYQDHVCSCAIRVAREVFALVPVERTFVNVGATEIDRATGHPAMTTFLAVHFLRPKLESLNFDRIDPSDAMKNFDHRMTFKKTSGFVGVEPMNGDEQFVSTA